MSARASAGDILHTASAVLVAALLESAPLEGAREEAVGVGGEGEGSEHERDQEGGGHFACVWKLELRVLKVYSSQTTCRMQRRVESR